MKKYIYFIIICLLSTLSYTVWSINTDIQNYIPRDTPGSLVLVDSSGSVYTDIPTAYGYYRAYTGSLSGVFIQDILYIEDRRYIQHSGVDIYAKASAIYDMAIYGIYRGASTIPEQYIKNTYSKEYTRGIYTKSREAMYSMILSQIYTKDQILRMYLDSIYF
jgi:membrane peptidoglycan carboxypeptidase